jgi:hypothetical protein
LAVPGRDRAPMEPGPRGDTAPRRGDQTSLSVRAASSPPPSAASRDARRIHRRSGLTATSGPAGRSASGAPERSSGRSWSAMTGPRTRCDRAESATLLGDHPRHRSGRSVLDRDDRRAVVGRRAAWAW